MPRGIPKEKKEDPIAVAITQLAGAISGLEKKLDSALEVKKPIVEEAKVEEEQIVEKEQEPEAPFPTKWREIIDEVLSKDFKASVKYLDNSRFELMIMVPKEYSNATPDEWKMYKADRRVVVMENFKGSAGIKEYCEIVAKQLGQEIMYRIHNDKARANA